MDTKGETTETATREPSVTENAAPDKKAKHAAVMRKARAQRRIERDARDQRKLAERAVELAKFKAPLGELSDDPLEGVGRLCAALIRAAESVMDDASLTPKEQRTELRLMARSITPLLPASRLLAAERTIREAHSAQARQQADPPLVDALPDDDDGLVMGPKLDG